MIMHDVKRGILLLLPLVAASMPATAATELPTAASQVLQQASPPPLIDPTLPSPSVLNTPDLGGPAVDDDMAPAVPPAPEASTPPPAPAETPAPPPAPAKAEATVPDKPFVPVEEPAPLPAKEAVRPAPKKVEKVEEAKPEKPTVEKPFAPVESTEPIAAAAAPEGKSKEDAAVQANEFRAALVNVYKHQPQLQAQRESLKATDEGVSQAISGFRPSAFAGYSYGRERSNVNRTGWGYNNPSDKSLTVEQPVFNGGETLASYKSAKDRVKAGRAQLTALEQQVLFNAVVSYTDVVEKQSVLEENQNNVDVLTKQYEATKARFDVGELTKTDLAQSQARLSSAQASERQSLGDLESSRATFKRVVGYDPPEQIALPPLPDALPKDMGDSIDAAEANDPTLEAARHLEKAFGSDVDVRTAAIFPDVDVTGTMDRRNGGSGGLGTGASRVSNDAVTLNLTIPLYQSGAEWSRIREAKDLAQQAKFSTMDTRDATVENATRAWQDYNTAKAVIVSNEQAVKAAEEALESIRQEALYGTRTILDVLNTEQDLFVARVGLVKAKVAEKQQAYHLLAAVGRLTARDLHLAVDLENPTQHYDDVKYKLIGF